MSRSANVFQTIFHANSILNERLLSVLLGNIISTNKNKIEESTLSSDFWSGCLVSGFCVLRGHRNFDSYNLDVVGLSFSKAWNSFSGDISSNFFRLYFFTTRYVTSIARHEDHQGHEESQSKLR